MGLLSGCWVLGWNWWWNGKGFGWGVVVVWMNFWVLRNVNGSMRVGFLFLWFLWIYEFFVFVYLRCLSIMFRSLGYLKYCVGCCDKLIYMVFVCDFFGGNFVINVWGVIVILFFKLRVNEGWEGVLVLLLNGCVVGLFCIDEVWDVVIVEGVWLWVVE